MTRTRSAVEGITHLEPRLLLAAQVYSTDFGFGAAGHVDAPADQLILPLPGGKIFTVGTHPVRRQVELVASRVNPDGTLDRSYGDSGSVDFGVTDGFAYLGGRLYVARDTGGASPDDIFRYTADGKLDTSFSEDGFEPVPFRAGGGGASVSVRSLAATPDGELLVRTWLNNSEFQISKLKPDGSLDTRFGDNGFITAPSGSPEREAVPLRGGLLLVTPTEPRTVDVVRYDINGQTVDTSFGNGGKITLPYDPQFHEQADGKLVVQIQQNTLQRSAMTLSRLSANGSADTGFGSNGRFVVQEQGPVAVSIDAQQRIVLGTEAGVTRLTSAGVPDAFPFNGTRIPRYTRAAAIAFDTAGRLLTGGFGGTLTRFDVVQPVVLANDHTLYVTGSADDDRLAITSPKRDLIKVSLNGAVTRFDAHDTAAFDVDAGEGNNVVFVPLNRPLAVVGGGGDDSLVSGDGNDRVTGGGGDDTIITGEGADTIAAGRGDNVIDCGDGDDRVSTDDDAVGGTASNVINGGNGGKSIVCEGGGGNTVTLGEHSSSSVTTGAGTGDDTITIAGGKNHVHVQGGHDVVRIGGHLANRVSVANGSLDATTGAGDDQFSFLLNSAGSVNAGGGNDAITASQSAGPFHFNGGDGDDLITVGDRAPVTIIGGNGDDAIVVGDRSRAIVFGNAGNDQIRAGDGRQTISGGAGKDTIDGGPGGDVISGNGGHDLLYGGSGQDRILGGDGDDWIDGGASDDGLSGEGGNDTLLGGAGNDRLSGDGGNDSLDGEAGSDYLAAGRGDDDLIAADGARDSIFGGAGHDRARVDRRLDLAAEVEL